MIKVTKYSDTKGTKKFKDFISEKFDIEMLNPENDKRLFDGWSFEKHNNYHEIINDSAQLEFHDNYYVIKIKNVPDIIASFPATIEEFINDMARFGVELYWNDWIDKIMDPKDYLYPEKIKLYYETILKDEGKSHELK